jgi:uncharacterized repeat protein (TIGR01451 family)
VVPGTLTIVKFEANNNYTQGPGQQIDFTICIINDTGAPVAIQSITDTLPNSWQWASTVCDMSGNPNLACSPPFNPLAGGTMSWGHQVLGQQLVMNAGERIDLRIHGTYTAPNPPCNGPVSAGIGYEVILGDGTVLNGNPACITVIP